MDQKKKKKWKKKAKVGPFTDPGERAVDDVQIPDHVTGGSVSPGFPNHGSSSAARSGSGPSDVPKAGMGAETPVKVDNLAKSGPPSLTDEADSTHGGDFGYGWDKLERFQQREREQGDDHPDGEAPVRDGKTWQSTPLRWPQSPPFLVEKEQLLAELRESKRELSAEREASELLRDQVESLTANISHVTAENEMLQSTIESFRVDMLRLRTENVELQMLVGKKGEAERLALAVQRLEMENFELQSLAASRKDENIRLEEESRQMSANMMALKRGIQQLERKAAVRAHIEQDIGSAASSTASKRWDGWTVKDPLAIAAAVAEESRLQKLAIAQTIEKLLEENDKLIRKVNEQAVVINDLTFSLQCKPMADTREATDLKRDDMKARFAFDSTSDAANFSRGINGHGLDGTNYHGQPAIENGLDESGPEEELSIRSAVRENHANIVPMHFHTTGAPPREQEIEELTVSSDTPSVPVEPSTNLLSEQSKPLRSPGSGRKTASRPFRFISLVTGYISGADLVRN